MISFFLSTLDQVKETNYFVGLQIADNVFFGKFKDQIYEKENELNFGIYFHNIQFHPTPTTTSTKIEWLLNPPPKTDPSLSSSHSSPAPPQSIHFYIV